MKVENVAQQDWKVIKSWPEWLLQFRSPAVLFETHSSYVAYEYYFYICALLALYFSFREGGRTPFIWLSAVLHGLWLEMLVYYIPDLDNFWQSHSSIMFFGHRYPLHILALYAYFIATGNAIARRLHLKWWAEPFAAGLLVVVLDFPMDILGIKLLWWTWHDTDPSIFDRFYWVPWTSFIFHATFTASNWFLFNGLHKIIAPGDRNEYRGIFREMIVTILAAMLTFPVGAMCFLFVYHPLHDFHGIHTENICIMVMVAYILIVFRALRRKEAPPKKATGWFDGVALLAFGNSIFYMFVVYFADPANISSTGYFQPIGPCNTTMVVQTLTGPQTRPKYLCPNEYRSSDYFNWDCLDKAERDEIMAIGRGDDESKVRAWYTVCGTAYPNRSEYIANVWAGCIFAAVLFYEILSRSKSLCCGENGKRKRE